MFDKFPGTTIELTKPEVGASRVLFEGIFATGGITLSQVCIMTGLEPYLVQNWVKRGFVTSPIGRVYSKEQFARVIIINMLREVLQIEKICKLLSVIEGDPRSTLDDLISDDELYHRYVDMLARGEINASRPTEVEAAAAVCASEDFCVRGKGEQKKLAKILAVMLYAHEAAEYARRSSEIISSLE